MAKLVFVNEGTGSRYEVVSFNQETGEVTLIGKHNQPFTEKFDKAKFERMGYTLKPEADAAPVPPAPPAPVGAVVVA